MKILLYGNGSAGNHGCEAIIRGTISLLNEHSFQIQSDSVEQDSKYGLNQLAEVMSARSPIRRDLTFILAYLKMKLFKKYVEMDGLQYISGIEDAKGNVDVALSVGGDNYCYKGTEIYPYLNRTYHKAGIKTILWGCSVEPQCVQDPAIEKDLALYDAIVTRESITYEAVKKVQKNTFLAPDPAFFMGAEPCGLDSRFEAGNVIGLNISPMIVSNETVSGIAYENYRRLVQHILDTTDAYVALIPHVVWDSNDDRTVLKKIYEDFNQNERLILVEDHTAPQLKYIISQCAFFVGARTHATIAAYSTAVPTLVVGYSVKARGIARDLFGNEDGYIVPVQELSVPEQLTKAFSALWVKRDEVRQHLLDFLPGYCQEAQSVRKMIDAME